MMRTALLVLGVALSPSSAILGEATTDFHAVPVPHASLRSSDPPRDGRLTSPPRRLLLWFTERPMVPLSKLTLVGPDGEVALGTLSPDTGNAIRANVLGAMANGTYKVVWQTAGTDGHVANGEYSFAVGTAAAADAPPPSAAAPASPAVRAPPIGARAIRLWEFVGLLVVIGVIVFVHGVLPPLATRGVYTADVSQQARGLGEVGAVVYLLSASFRLINQAAAAPGTGSARMNSLLEIVLRSGWGNGWLVGEVGAVLVIAGLLLSMRRIRAGTPIALTGALAMTLSPALTGHAVAARLFIPSVTLDALHVASIGAWLGTLAVVVLVGIPAMARVKDGNPDAAVSALVNSFHPIALLAAPLAVFAGLGSSALRLGSVRALTTSQYGTVLITKLAAVALVASFGAWNSMRARRHLGNPQATASIRRTAAIEVALAVLVLWATTDLIATAAPTELP